MNFNTFPSAKKESEHVDEVSRNLLKSMVARAKEYEKEKEAEREENYVFARIKATKETNPHKNGG